ncbi:MAG: hypothetical protein LBR08_13550 [Bacteroidales bacterium]|jgi:hypothetical protein|nr:hypothetical protein [Bacteroidales bacterium]
MIQGLYSVPEVTEMIGRGDVLLLAGDVDLLAQLPAGKWIGGSTTRFILHADELVESHDKIFVHNLSEIAGEIKISVYDPSTISNIFDDAYDNGFSVLIMAWGSDTLKEYSINVSSYHNFACKVICGWITKNFFDNENPDISKAVCGKDGSLHSNSGVVMHVALPADKYAEVHTFSPFKQGKGDVFMFEENGLQVENACINGIKQNFRQYLESQKIDRSVECIVAGDFAGTIMNVYLLRDQKSDRGKYVSFSAPVYGGVEYRFAEIDLSYEEPTSFEGDIVFSLTCITNYTQPEVFKKYLRNMHGPFTYGEIAYHLMNHATIYVTVGNVQEPVYAS